MQIVQLCDPAPEDSPPWEEEGIEYEGSDYGHDPVKEDTDED